MAQGRAFRQRFPGERPVSILTRSLRRKLGGARSKCCSIAFDGVPKLDDVGTLFHVDRIQQEYRGRALLLRALFPLRRLPLDFARARTDTGEVETEPRSPEREARARIQNTTRAKHQRRCANITLEQQRAEGALLSHENIA